MQKVPFAYLFKFCKICSVMKIYKYFIVYEKSLPTYHVILICRTYFDHVLIIRILKLKNIVFAFFSNISKFFVDTGDTRSFYVLHNDKRT